MSLYENIQPLKAEKRHAISVAKQLCYPDCVLEAIEEAKSQAEVYRILASARNRM